MPIINSTKNHRITKGTLQPGSVATPMYGLSPFLSLAYRTAVKKLLLLHLIIIILDRSRPVAVAVACETEVNLRKGTTQKMI